MPADFVLDDRQLLSGATSDSSKCQKTMLSDDDIIMVADWNIQ